MKRSTQDFLQHLEQEALRQKQLYRHRVLPPQLDALTTFVGTYAWQVLVIAAFVTAVLIEVV
jgi:hypothetical protein